MKYTHEIINSKRIIILRIYGVMERDEAMKASSGFRPKAKDLNYGIVVDFRKAKNRITIAQAYNWFSDSHIKLDNDIRSIPTAYITNEEDEGFFVFVETTFLNKGLNVKLFKDEDEAFKWIECKLEMNNGSHSALNISALL